MEETVTGAQASLISANIPLASATFREKQKVKDQLYTLVCHIPEILHDNVTRKRSQRDKSQKEKYTKVLWWSQNFRFLSTQYSLDSLTRRSKFRAILPTSNPAMLRFYRMRYYQRIPLQRLLVTQLVTTSAVVWFVVRNSLYSNEWEVRVEESAPSTRARSMPFVLRSSLRDM